MYHSITFWTNASSPVKIANTYDDFCLVPDTIPVIAPPSTKKQIIDLPGGNGSLDLTDSLLRYPVYENRTGNLKFNVLNNRERMQNIAWTDLYSKIMNLTQGRLVLISLEDDPNWFYKGRLDLINWTPSNDGKWPTVEFDYDLEPYKMSKTTKTLTYSITSTSSLALLKTLTKNDIGMGPVSPTLTIPAANTTIKIVNSATDYSYEKTFTNSGTYTDPAIILYDFTGGGIKLYGKGSGNLKIAFNERSL